MTSWCACTPSTVWRPWVTGSPPGRTAPAPWRCSIGRGFASTCCSPMWYCRRGCRGGGWRRRWWRGCRASGCCTCRATPRMPSSTTGASPPACTCSASRFASRTWGARYARCWTGTDRGRVEGLAAGIFGGAHSVLADEGRGDGPALQHGVAAPGAGGDLSRRGGFILGVDESGAVGQLPQADAGHVHGFGHADVLGVPAGDVGLFHLRPQGGAVHHRDQQVEHVHAPVLPLDPQGFAEVEHERLGAGVH